MHKGQIFSTDFLFAMVLIILGIGLLLGSFELNSYNTKEIALRAEMKEKAETAAIVLTNNIDYDCNIGTTEIAYSINTDKLNIEKTNTKKLKEKLGLQDYNINIYIDPPLTAYVSEVLPNVNIIGIDLNVLVCTNAMTQTDLNRCISTSLATCQAPKIQLQKLTIKVAK